MLESEGQFLAQGTLLETPCYELDELLLSSELEELLLLASVAETARAAAALAFALPPLLSINTWKIFFL